MTILQALVRYYDRLPGVAAQGWSSEKFGWCIVLNADGDAVEVETLHDLSGKKPRPTLRVVPAAVKRTVAIAPNFLWDKSAYVLGRTAGEGRRTVDEHAAFVALHLERLAGQGDVGLVALRRFLENWRPERFDELPRGTPDILDANILFRLEGERGYLHERPAARALVEAGAVAGDGVGSLCLVTGEIGPIARLHPTIKGVEGAQSSGAALVSFNLDAFTSLGKEQGANAPTSEAAAFRYGEALNKLLRRDSRNRLPRPIGDTTVVFWADSSDVKAAEAADMLAGDWLLGGADEVSDAQEAAKVREQLEKIAAGRPIQEIADGIEPGTRFHILGLSPNAARLSVRFWLCQSFSDFARALAQHYQDMRVEPLPFSWGAAPSVGRLLVNSTAAQRDYKNIPHALAGEVLRAVLYGGRYPQTLLATALIRLRAGDDAGSGWHAAVIRGVLVREGRAKPLVPESGELPMSLQRDYQDAGYQLGRLFAVYELAQRSALGRVNASIRDKYFGAASAAPASVFPIIVRGGQNHLAKVRKEKPGWAALIERELEEIHGHLAPALPRSLTLQKQGEFAVGYYHQRAAKLSDGKEVIDPATLNDTTNSEGEA
ncbi:CRISPR-associated protein Csd1 [Sphingobium sp. SYK-6]|uniref:type I-C CRISPR-associated protein Cas8c/Csd1 n=1 Tax=Sphingobium sp. (strain NBRC 103272 / SYK-6) TaxID=627192 RepID=UPI00022771A9|nr:type I-C CRISPR-associated protein Cas8c/Csd1 [Sphingobium sp. SYK-6]BAK66415.1 CRISPR-associated protein Csd1 [Sphingobium sp. SYK-6]